MQKNDYNLLKYLYENNEWITSKMLSARFNISIRTIRYCIKRLNSNDTLILSSNKGYRINNAKREIIQHSLSEYSTIKQTLPNVEERQKQILRLLLISSKSLHIDDLCEKFYISDTTLKADLQKIKPILENNFLQLNYENDFYSIVGKEQGKRRIIAKIISEEVSDIYDLRNKIRFILSKDRFDDVYEIVHNVFKKYSYYVNDYAFYNLIIHLLIVIDRINNQCILNNEKFTNERKNDINYLIAEEIFQHLKTELNVLFVPQEVLDFSILIETQTLPASHLNFTDMTRLNDFMGEELTNLISYIIDSVNLTFYTDINCYSFYLKFSLHIKNLLARARLGRYSKNPFAEQIKMSFPMVYEIASFIAYIIFERTGYKINEDEIAYLAMHIACIFGESKEESVKKALLICPTYHDMAMKLVNDINNEFYGKIHIMNVYNKEEYIRDVSNIDIIITTFKLEKDYKKPVVHVNPILNKHDIEKIQNCIETLSKKKTKAQINNLIIPLFHEHLFLKNCDFKNEEEAIRYMTNLLYEYGFVDDNYYDKVMEREKISSTAFGSIAIPHSLKAMAKKSCICISLHNKPINWNNQRVSIILLIAINKNDQLLFNEIFSKLTEMLFDQTVLNRIYKCKNYNEFIKVMTSSV